MTDAGFIAFYVLLYVGVVLLLPLTSPFDRRHAVARRNHSGARGRCARSRDPRRPRPREHRRLDLDRRDEPLLSARRRAAPLSGHSASSSLTGWRPGPRWLVLGLGILATTAADADLPVPVVERDVRGRHVGGHPLARRDVAHRLVRVVARPHARGTRGRGPAAPRRTRSLRARRHGHPRLRPLHAVEPARDHPGLADARERSSRDSASTFRENRRLFELTREEATTDSLTGSRTADSSSRISSAV